jgi:hypothetical protein
MRCLACGEDVDEGRAMPIYGAIATIDAGGGEGYIPLRDGRFHLRYVEGVLPEGPETSPLHAGPVICGPLDQGGA